MSSKQKVLTIIQARMASTRLPGKVLKLIEGTSVLEHVISRVGASELVDEIIVATTINKEDLAIVKLCANLGVRVFCGSESDVLDRFYQAARLIEPGHIVRITADCPLIDPDLIDEVITHHLRSKADYSTNTLKESYPDGEDVEVMSFTALKRAWLNAKYASEREHVTLFIRNNAAQFRMAGLEYGRDLSAKRWTLDNKEDFDFITRIYAELHQPGRIFGMAEILALLEKDPELETMNRHIKRNEGLQKSLRDDRLFELMEEGKDG